MGVWELETTEENKEEKLRKIVVKQSGPEKKGVQFLREGSCVPEDALRDGFQVCLEDLQGVLPGERAGDGKHL